MDGRATLNGDPAIAARCKLRRLGDVDGHGQSKRWYREEKWAKLNARELRDGDGRRVKVVKLVAYQILFRQGLMRLLR